MVLLLQYTLIFASVLILVALGGCFAEHSGVINLGLEGIMIMGALGGALAMRYISPNVPAIVMILGVLAISALVGMIYSCLLAVACINFKADQTLVGTALNLLGTAGATVIVKAINTCLLYTSASSTAARASASRRPTSPTPRTTSPSSSTTASVSCPCARSSASPTATFPAASSAWRLSPP